jgi:hypothetical protein
MVFKMANVPIFTPSEEQFADFDGLMSKILETGQHYGVCKVIPPSSWKSDFSIDSYQVLSIYLTTVYLLTLMSGDLIYYLEAAN